MKYLLSIAILAASIVFAPVMSFASEENTKEGAIKLQNYSFGDDINKKNVIALGEKVNFSINAYLDEFFGETIINANATITNKTTGAMQAIYVIRFYDDAGNIIGAHATNWTLKPNESINYGSALIRGKNEDFAKITKYKVYACSYETLPKKE